MVDIVSDLSDLGKPVYIEGEAPKDLPNEYFTISEDYTSDHLSADNEPKEILYEFTIRYFTNNAKTLYEGLSMALSLLKRKGYITSGVGYSAPSYGEWYSRQADVKKLEYL
jgi:hypothetical protein